MTWAAVAFAVAACVGCGLDDSGLRTGLDDAATDTAVTSDVRDAEIAEVSRPSCTDGVRNGDETDVDCGGSCPRCVVGRGCGRNADCDSGVCAGSTCANPSCSDDATNGDETDVDCGGPTCPACKNGSQCKAATDCESRFCDITECRFARSCKVLLAMTPGALSGKYVVDPDGTGGNAPFEVACDMATDGGGWTFLGHVNGNWTGGALFDGDVGTYRADRVDDETTYGIGRSLLPFVGHTSMMVTLDTADPAAAAAASKVVFFRYAPGALGFNKGPLPCAGLSSGFEYRTTLTGAFVTGGTTDACDGERWHARTAGNTSYLIAFNGASPLGARWGAGMGGNDGFLHDAWIWVR